jgi:hypothetical protein
MMYGLEWRPCYRCGVRQPPGDLVAGTLAPHTDKTPVFDCRDRNRCERFAKERQSAPEARRAVKSAPFDPAFPAPVGDVEAEIIRTSLRLSAEAEQMEERQDARERRGPVSAPPVPRVTAAKKRRKLHRG